MWFLNLENNQYFYTVLLCGLSPIVVYIFGGLLLYTNLLLTITLGFTCNERKIWQSIKKVTNYHIHHWLQNFLLLCLSLLIAQISKNSLILGKIYLTFLEKPPRPNYKVFQYKTWTLVKKFVKQLSRKTNFDAFLRLISSKFGLRLSLKH